MTTVQVKEVEAVGGAKYVWVKVRAWRLISFIPSFFKLDQLQNHLRFDYTEDFIQ